MALAKNGNVYLIIDTDEIPILDVDLIDEGYDQVINKGETVAMFKRKKNRVYLVLTHEEKRNLLHMRMLWSDAQAPHIRGRKQKALGGIWAFRVFVPLPPQHERQERTL